MIGVSHPLSINVLLSLLNQIIPNTVQKGPRKSLNFNKKLNAMLKRLTQITSTEYNSTCLAIKQTPFKPFTKCFHKKQKMLDFFDYILYIHRLCILLKLFLLFPLLKELQTLEEKQTNKQNDIFLKTAKVLKHWLFQAHVVSFNGNRFDNVLLFNATLPTLLTSKKVKIDFQKAGTSLINIWYKYLHTYKTHSSQAFKTKKKPKKTSWLKVPSYARLGFKVS